MVVTLLHEQFYGDVRVLPELWNSITTNQGCKSEHEDVSKSSNRFMFIHDNAVFTGYRTLLPSISEKPTFPMRINCIVILVSKTSFAFAPITGGTITNGYEAHQIIDKKLMRTEILKRLDKCLTKNNHELVVVMHCSDEFKKEYYEEMVKELYGISIRPIPVEVEEATLRECESVYNRLIQVVDHGRESTFPFPTM